jgi:hypothetical protein
VLGRRTLCRSLTAAVLGVALLAPAPGAPTRATASATRAGGVSGLAAHRAQLAAATNTVCTDRAATWMGSRWRGTVRWRLNEASIPAYLPVAATRAAIRRAAEAVAGGANRCGLRRTLGMVEHYAGTTRRNAGVSADGRCARPDGTNEVSFGSLAAGLLAVTCVWWRTGRHGADAGTVEADIRISATAGLFFTTAGTCRERFDLQGAITHEFGHVYGLGHVSGVSHPAMVMGDSLPPCDTAHRGLGLGDYAMLRAHYRS